MRRVAVAVFALCIVMSFFGGSQVDADDGDNRGLLVTPIRAYKTVDPGGIDADTLTVANLTKNAIDVSLSTEQFSVVDYTYDFTFERPREDWIRLAAVDLHLEAGESKAIKYQVEAPKTAEPGGHYFTLLASTSLKPNEKVQAATMLYVTVNGNLVKTSAILDDSVPTVSFGGDIPFHFTAKNTGNTHFFAYTTGKLEGLSAQSEKNDAAHVLMPQTSRVLEGTFSAPLLPGIYKANYGFKTDGGALVTHEKYIVYAPLWAVALLVGAAWLLVVWFRRRARRRSIGFSPRQYT